MSTLEDKEEMTRWLAALGSVSGLLLTGCVLMATHIDWQVRSEPVYTVAQVQENLMRHPGRWLGRIVRVRAIAGLCGDWIGPAFTGTCTDPRPALVDVASHGSVQTMPLVIGHVSPLLALLHDVPVLAALAPTPQDVRWSAVDVYRIQLISGPCRLGDQPPCYAALLLDAAPDTPGTEAD